MPRIIRCPNCRATLTRPSDVKNTNCDYCGAAILAHSAPSERFFVRERRILRSPVMIIVAAIVGTTLASSIVIALLMTIQTRDDTLKAASSSAAPAPAPGGKIELPVRPVVLGEWSEVELPPWSPGVAKEVVAAFSLDVPAAGFYAVETQFGAITTQCSASLLDDKGRVIVSADDKRTRFLYSPLHPGRVLLSVNCRHTVVSGNLKARFLALPDLPASQPLPLTIDEGDTELFTRFSVDRAGLFTFALESDDTTDRLEVIDAKGQVRSKGRVAIRANRSVLNVELEPGLYRAGVSRGGRNTAARRIVLAAHRNDPVQLTPGATVSGTLDRFIDSRHYSLSLSGPPTHIEARLASPMMTVYVEIIDAQGVRIASAMSLSGRGARVVTPDPVSAGHYRVVVRGPSHSVNTGPFTLTVNTGGLR